MQKSCTLMSLYMQKTDLPSVTNRHMAWANLALAPFLIVFLAIHFFLRNAEQLYHHPSSVGARRWSPLARWRLREFNELPHYIDHRCGGASRGCCCCGSALLGAWWCCESARAWSGPVLVRGR